MENVKSKRIIEGKSDLFNLIPEDIVLIILNKLDNCITLCRFATTCSKFLQLLPQIRCLSTSLPFSLLKSEKSLTWYTCITQPCNENHQSLSELINEPSFANPRSRRAYISVVILKNLFYYMDRHHYPVQDVADANKKKVTNSRLLERFTSLDSLVVTLETPASEACYIGHGSPWFRWDAELYEMAKLKGYIVVVVGNIVQHDTEGEKIANPGNFSQLDSAIRHVLFHWSTARLLLSKARTNVRSIVTKDANNEGKLRLYRSQQLPDETSSSSKCLEDLWFTSEPKPCFKFCYSTTTLKVNKSREIKDAAFLFISWVEDGNTTAMGDSIGSCLGFGQIGEDDDRKELRETVMKILAGEKLLNLPETVFKGLG